MTATLTQAEARQHALQAQRGSMKSLQIVLEHLIGGDVGPIDNMEITALTVDGIAGGDSSLGITGEAAAQGGAIVITGGTSSTAGNAGGALTVTGGTPGATSIGGAVTVTSGAGGSTSAASGALVIVGGVTSDTAAGTAANTGVITITTGAPGNDTTSGVGGDSGALTIATGAPGTSATGNSGASGAIIIETAAGGLVTGNSDSATVGASGALTLRTGAGGALTAGNSTAGAGGTISITGGAGGEAIEDTDDTGGAGANINLTAGAGGDGQTAGVGGSIILTSGTIGTDGGSGPPIGGSIFLRGDNATAPATPIIRGQKLAASDTGAQTLTVAEVLTGIHLNDPQGAVAITLPTGQALHNALPADFQTGDSFDFTLINLNGATTEIQTLTDPSGTGVTTFKGSAALDPPIAKEGSGSGTWRFVSTGSNNFDAFRIA